MNRNEELYAERNRAIREAYREQQSYSAVGRQFGLDPSRIYQIVAYADPEKRERLKVGIRRRQKRYRERWLYS